MTQKSSLQANVSNNFSIQNTTDWQKKCLLAQRLQSLPNEKQQVFRAKLAEQGINSWQLPIVGNSANTQLNIPLSAAQSSLWFIQTLADEDGSQFLRTSYNLNSNLLIKGDLNLEIFKRALELFFIENEIFYTIYLRDTETGKPIQTLLPNPESVFNEVWHFQRIDYAYEENQQRVNDIINKQKLIPFELSSKAPIAFFLNQFNCSTWMFSITVHHIAFDAWSEGIMIGRLCEIYDQLLQNTANTPEQNTQVLAKNIPENTNTELPTYKDYAIWQEQWLAGSDAQLQLDYWQKHLQNCQLSLPLPRDFAPSNNLSDSDIFEVDVTLSKQFFEKLTHITQQHNATPYHWLLTAFKWLLCKYTNSYDINVGTSVALRDRPELQNLVGMFVNTLVLRDQFTHDSPFLTSLNSVKNTVKNAYDYKEYPFYRLLDALNIDRASTYHSLFQVLFVYVDLPSSELPSIHGASLTPILSKTQEARFELTLRVEELINGDVKLRLEFDPKLYRESTVTQMLVDYEALLLQLNNDIDLNLQNWLPPSVINQYKSSNTRFNNVKAISNNSEIANNGISSAFNAYHHWVHQTPSAPALIWQDEAEQTIFTYAEFDQQANLLAGVLQQQGINQNDCIAFVSDRAYWQIIAVIAAWKLGASYVALDAQWPNRRINELLAIIKPKCVLHNCNTDCHYFNDDNTGYVADISIALENDILAIEKLSKQFNSNASANILTFPPNLSVAYYIFTSGSTGKPKAVAISHRALSTYTSAINNALNLPNSSQLTSVSSLATDLGHTAVFGALLNGHCLRWFATDLINDPMLLAKKLQQNPVDVIKLTPSHVKAFTPVLELMSPSYYWVCGGESLSADTAETLLKINPQCQLINHYGPTETTVGALINFVTLNDIARYRSQGCIDIGKPLKGYRALILNEYNQLTVPGCIGELAIAGDALADGYHDDPTATDHSFIEVDILGEHLRVYKTSDQVRINKLGNIEYIGRNDNQVKIRGNRVELNEIEQKLEAFEGISNAVALFIGNVDDQPVNRLVAFITGEISQKQNTEKYIEQITQSLEQQLPNYAVPETLRILEQFPLLASGKIDRKKLINDYLESSQKLNNVQQNILDNNGKQNAIVTAVVVTEDQQQLLSIWRKVLQRDDLTIHDDFFRVGGDSILSLQVIALARKSGIKLTPKEFFKKKSISKLLPNNPSDDVNSKDLTVSEGVVKKNGFEKIDSEKTATDISIVEKDLNSFPLSLSQERIAWLEDFNGGDNSYHLNVALCFAQKINQQAIERTLKHLIFEHESFRMGFKQSAGQYRAFVIDGFTAVNHFSIEILPSIDTAKIWTEHGFCLDQPPLLRAAIIEQQDESILLLKLHHIITDGWSMRLFTEQAIAHYTHYCEDKNTQNNEWISELPADNVKAARVQYSDYAIWQRQQSFSDDIHFWQSFLATTPSYLNLPNDTSVTGTPNLSDARHHSGLFTAQLSNDLCRQLDEYLLTQTQGLTASNLLLSSFALALYRVCQQSQFRIGLPVSGRVHPDLNDIIGLFINTLVIPFDLKPEQSASEFITTSQENVQAALNHQNVPFECLVKELEQHRDTTKTPLFNVLFNFQHSNFNKTESIDNESVTIDRNHFGQSIAKFELTLDVTETRAPQQRTYQLEWEYKAECFSKATIKNLQDYFSLSLQWLLNESKESLHATAKKLAEFDDITENNQQLLNVTNTTQGEVSINAVRDIITQGIKQKHKTAIIDQFGSLSYQNLLLGAWSLSAEINSRLEQSDIQPENNAVIICLERDRSLPISLLACWLAGKAYVPIDPNHPKDRNQLIIESCRASVCIVSNTTNIDGFSGITVNVDKVLKNTVTTPEELDYLTQQALPGQNPLAYSLYTSGSTGKPKGVLIEFDPLNNFLQAMQNIFQLNDTDVCLASTTITFDIAGLELWLPLVHGATVVLASEAQRVSELSDLIAKYGVNLVQATPSGWKLLLEQVTAAKTPTLLSQVTAICGGEALSESLARRIQNHTKTVFNVYGPTETTIWSTCYQVSNHFSHYSGNVAIGKPILNTQCLVLDSNHNQVPVGAVGELFIGGHGLAKGYAGQEQLTREKFVHLEKYKHLATRFYQTGDRVRYNNNGDLQFVSRTDSQIKLRGYRIELGEIENALESISGIQQAAVILKDTDEHAYLAAFIQLVEDTQRTDFAKKDLIVAQLKALIPTYMVPQCFTVLENLPLNTNGKIDRLALAGIDINDTTKETQQNINADCSQTQGIVLNTWQELLFPNYTDVELRNTDNFFELGGHSLLASQALARINTHFNFENPINLRQFFDNATIGQLSNLCDAKLTTAESTHTSISGLVKIEASFAKRAPVSTQQYRLWLAEQFTPAAYNMSLAVKLKGAVNLEAVNLAIKSIFDRHESLRTRFELIGEHLEQVIDDTTALPFTTQKITGCTDTDVENLRNELLKQRFDLQTQLPFNVYLIESSPSQYYLIFIIHHIITDEWSMNNLVAEFTKIYSSYTKDSNQEQFVLPNLTIQYKDYSIWQHKQFTKSYGEQLDEFWQQQLKNYKNFQWPQNSSGQVRKNGLAKRLNVLLSQEQTAVIKSFARAQNTSEFIVLSAIFRVWLARLVSANDVVIGTDFANRPSPDLEPLVGFFINLLPLRLSVDEHSTFAEIVSHEKEHFLEVNEFQQQPYEKVIEHYRANNSSDRSALIKFLLVMQNTPAADIHLPDLSVSVLPNSNQTARFDLSVFINLDKQCELQWVYDCSIFDDITINHYATQLSEILNTLTRNPNQKIASLSDLKPTKIERVDSKKNKLSKLKYLKSKKDNSALDNNLIIEQCDTHEKSLVDDKNRVTFGRWVRSSSGSDALPYVFLCNNSDINSTVWVKEYIDTIHEKLLSHGAVLFRNFGLQTPVDFEQFVESMHPQLFGKYGDLPKKEGGKNIYRSTPYPDDRMILFHNESSHMSRWPRKQWFFSEIVATEGGATPIVDCRLVYQQLPENIKYKLLNNGLLYARTFLPGVDVSWQDFFKTDSKQQVETICETSKIQWQWLQNNKGLQISQRSPGIIKHPITQEFSFFNQVQLHHPACLEPEVRQDLVALVDQDQLPRNVYYGDGSVISDEEMAVIGELYEVNAIRPSWQAGDVLMVDNMLIAHARDPFKGPRKIAVAMADMYEQSDVWSPPTVGL
ncbi:non-ribosomal peptide synthetase [Sessilibacter sp. MAH4]